MVYNHSNLIEDLNKSKWGSPEFLDLDYFFLCEILYNIMNLFIYRLFVYVMLSFIISNWLFWSLVCLFTLLKLFFSAFAVWFTQLSSMLVFTNLSISFINYFVLNNTCNWRQLRLVIKKMLHYWWLIFNQSSFVILIKVSYLHSANRQIDSMIEICLSLFTWSILFFYKNQLLL